MNIKVKDVWLRDVYPGIGGKVDGVWDTDLNVIWVGDQFIPLSEVRTGTRVVEPPPAIVKDPEPEPKVYRPPGRPRKQ